MAAGAIIGALISAVIGGGATMWAQEEQNKETQKARKEALGLESQARGDVLENQAYGRALGRQLLALNQANTNRQFSYSAQQVKLNRAERTEDKNYQRKVDTYNRALGILNNNITLRDRMSAYWGGAR